MFIYYFDHVLYLACKKFKKNKKYLIIVNCIVNISILVLINVIISPFIIMKEGFNIEKEIYSILSCCNRFLWQICNVFTLHNNFQFVLDFLVILYFSKIKSIIWIKQKNNCKFKTIVYYYYYKKAI